MEIPLALTYDDVLLVPQRSRITSRKMVDTTGHITPKIALKVPIVGANMDSVADARMCIALAREGGVGILHRFVSIEDMCHEISRVKRAESVVIKTPHVIDIDASIADAHALMYTENVSGLPVMEHGKLVGILTRRDMAAAEDAHSHVSDIMTTRDRLVVGDADVDPDNAKSLMQKARVEKLPLVDGDDHLVGLITMKDLNYQDRYPLATKDAEGRLVVGAAVGVRGDYLDRARACEAAGADFLCLDIAHGHAEHAIEAVKELKKTVSIEIVAGNVATYEGARDLIAAGADGIKTGVGPGAVCITRTVAGVGVPQLTAVLESARACHEAGIPLCADGGIRIPADFSKALAAGADTIMIGSLLAGCDESPGELINRNGRLFKTYRGMASAGAAKARLALDDKPVVEKRIDAQNDDEMTQTTPEGVEAVVAARGPVKNVIHSMVGGLRSAMSYSDSTSVKEYHEKAQFVRITSAGLTESHPHDVEL